MAATARSYVRGSVGTDLSEQYEGTVSLISLTETENITPLFTWKLFQNDSSQPETARKAAAFFNKLLDCVRNEKLLKRETLIKIF